MTFLSSGPISSNEAERVTVDALCQNNAETAANCFHENGVVIVRNLFPQEAVKEIYAQALKNFIFCLTEVRKRGVRLGKGTKHGYAEVVKRTKGRFEMLYNMDALYKGKMGKVLRTSDFLSNFLCSDNVLGDEYHLLYCDLLISFPGAVDQQWHTDGGHRPGTRDHLPAHVLNCFIALDDIAVEMGPTEIRPCSQKLTRDIKKQMLFALLRKQLRPRIRPSFSCGDACIFDYRTLHRGIANMSKKPRPVLGLVFARKWFQNDKINFPPRSIFDLNVQMSQEERCKNVEKDFCEGNEEKCAICVYKKAKCYGWSLHFDSVLATLRDSFSTRGEKNRKSAQTIWRKDESILLASETAKSCETFMKKRISRGVDALEGEAIEVAQWHDK
eukprot:g6202.t1